MSTPTTLVKIIEQSGLDKSKSDYLLEKFADYTAIAAEWEKKAKEIVVTDESQTDLMKQASEGRKLLKNKRVDIEKTRKELKAASLAEGRAIDEIAKSLTALIEPTEDYLQLQEDFAKIKEKQRAMQLHGTRIHELIQYVDASELSSSLELGYMPESQFQAMLTGYKVNYENKIAAEKKAEEDRIAKEEQDKKDREAQRIENERLKKEAEQREKTFAEELLIANQKAQKERAEIEAKAKAEREESEKILLAERKLAKEKLDKEMESARKLAAELQAKKDQEQKEIEEAEKLASAGDKEKIKDLIVRLTNFDLPEVNSKKAKQIIAAAQIKLMELIDNVTVASSKL